MSGAFPCDDCGRWFDTARGLSMHHKCMHAAERRRSTRGAAATHTCSACGWSANTTARGLAIHQTRFCPSNTTKRVCSVDGCDEPHYARSYCRSHYDRHRKAPRAPRVKEPAKCAASVREPVTCECGQVFTNEQGRKLHRDTPGRCPFIMDPTRWLPVEPLVQRVQALLAAETPEPSDDEPKPARPRAKDLFGDPALTTTYYGAVRRGIVDVYDADRLAVRLHVHPAALYEDAWWEAAEWGQAPVTAA